MALRLLLLVALAGWLPATAGAQESEPGSTHLKGLEPLVGTWRRTDAPPLGPNTFAARWILNRNCLEIRMLREKESQSDLAAVCLVYWNPKTRRIESHSYGPDGVPLDSTWTVDGNTMTEVPEGLAAKSIRRKVAGDTLTFTMDVPGIAPIEFSFRRTKP